MQKFSYHTHTNALGIFDGHHSAAEMIRRAEEIGYEEIGISNHLVYHPNLLTTSPMFFNDFDLLKKMMQKNVDDIRRAAEKASIPVYAGFEVDFFPSAMWRNAFEKLTETLNADYYVGSFHFLRNTDESRVYNMYHYKESGSPLRRRTGRRRSQLLAQRLSGGGKRLFRLYRPFGRLQDFSRFCAARHGRRQTGRRSKP